MSHLYESQDGVIHLCEDGQNIANDSGTYTVWTKCEIDVPANKSFKSDEEPTCITSETLDCGCSGYYSLFGVHRPGCSKEE